MMERLQEEQDQQTQLTIEKALEFAGDNSEYQKRRLLLVTLLILPLAVLTCKVALTTTTLLILFLAASGLGQLLGPAYLSLDICAVGMFVSAALACLAYPLAAFPTHCCYLLLGFFGRGFFGCSMLYLNEIGGERFRSWSLIVIFAAWGISALLSALEDILRLPPWIWHYGLIFLPILIASRQLVLNWKPSPYHLFRRRLFAEAREVLNDMAEQNGRPAQQHLLEGQNRQDDLYRDKTLTLYDLLFEPSLQKLTIPLAVLWVFREYIYFGSFSLVVEVSEEFGKNYILISISETVAVLLSYPIRMKIRRVSTFFTLALIIACASAVCSFTVVSEQCWPRGEPCSAKLLYRIAIMLIRFSIALTGNVLVAYTLEVYPSNAKHLAYSFLLGISSAGSILLPSLNELIIQAGLSGFIAFALLSLFPLYLTPRLPQTGGKINEQPFLDWQKRTPLIPVQNWNQLNI